MLDTYIAGSPLSYDEIARARSATYFSMADWDMVLSQVGKDKMWSINEKFLDNQVKLGKSFLFTVDPRLSTSGYYTQKEYDYLFSKGYNLITEGGYYRAIKK